MGKLGINWVLLLAQLINFGLVAFLLARLLYRPVLNALQARTQRIQESIENAEQVKQQLGRVQQDYDAEISRARQEAAQIVCSSDGAGAGASERGDRERSVGSRTYQG